jgi:hypothetical protein
MVEEVGFDDFIKQKTQYGRRQEGHEQLHVNARLEQKALCIQENNGENGAQLDENLKGFGELIFSVAEQMGKQDHVTGGRNGEEFGQAFYDGGQNGVNYGHV